MRQFIHSFLRISANLCLVMVPLLVAGISFTIVKFPYPVPERDLKIELTPQRVARGQYLVNHVAFCLNCHSPRNWNLVAGPVAAETLGMGAQTTIFGGAGTFAPNISPTGIGTRSDSELRQAIVGAPTSKGEAPDPDHPHHALADLAAEDLHAIIAYLRTLAPQPLLPQEAQGHRESKPKGQTAPKPFEPKSAPDPADRRAYGEYLVRLAQCSLCHGADYSGGKTLQIPGGDTLVSANLTPVPGTRTEKRTREEFISIFQSLQDEDIRNKVVVKGGMNTVMPWIQYSDMTAEDLGAIYDYLRSLKPVVE